MKFRTAQVNGLRGLLAEYGEVMPQGRAGIRRDAPAALGRVAERLPAVLIDTLREQYARVGELDEQVQQIERRPKNVAIVALANKMARTIWALLAHQREYEPTYVSRPA